MKILTMEKIEIIGSITTYPYKRVPFIDYQPFRQVYDAWIQVELPPELIRLMQQQSVHVLLMNGDMGHDAKVWQYMRGATRFRRFLQDAARDPFPTLLLIPVHLLPMQRKLFHSDGILLNEYGGRREISNKLCQIGVYFKETGVDCTILPEPTGLN